jgi:dihydroflavonol-4-reductase
MKVAVTGANGLVGVNLISKLLEQGDSVKALIHRKPCVLSGFDVEIIEGDIMNDDMLTHLFSDVDVVFHAAAKISIGNTPYEELYKTNVEGTQKVFSIAKRQGVRTFIHFSSIHAMQQPDKNKPFSEKYPLATDSPFSYEKTKALAQQWLQNQKGNGMKVVILNPTAIIGPYDFKPSLVGEFLIKTVNHQLPGIIEGGYDWVDVRDVAQAAIAAIEKGKDGEHYILSGKWLSLEEIIQLMENVLGEKIKPFVFPMWLAKTGLPFLSLWAKVTRSKPLYTSESLKILQLSSRTITSEKAKRTLGYSPRIVDQTIKDTMVWFNENGFIQF